MRVVMTKICWSKTFLCFLFLVSCLAFKRSSETSTILLDGISTKIYFSDGDTFRILDGVFKNSYVRVNGINALETYGPIHKWSNSSLAYLWKIANYAKVAARRGSWTCKTHTKKDTYGRMLATCDDLAIELLKNGLAHAYSVDSSPASKVYLHYQKTAQETRNGMWQNGVPDFIITSVHSAEEKGTALNRKISTQDGHSEKWSHSENYPPCHKVCLEENSCLIYVPYKLRYGNNRPDCLRY